MECPKCKKESNRFEHGVCRSCFRKQRRLDSPLVKCQCGDPDCKEMIHSISYHGDVVRFAQGHGSKGENNSNYGKYGSKSANWNKGITYDKTSECFMLYKPYHPYVNKRGYVKQYRIIKEIYLSIKYGYPVYINPNLVVHHINHVRMDNRPENLEIMTKSDHVKHHKTGIRGKKYNEGTVLKEFNISNSDNTVITIV